MTQILPGEMETAAQPNEDIESMQMLDSEDVADASAAGIDAARHDRLVWSDEDFHHPSDWLATLNADYEVHGPMSEVPSLIGGRLSVLRELLYGSAGSLGISLGNQIWVGAVMFDQSDIDGRRVSTIFGGQ